MLSNSSHFTGDQDSYLLGADMVVNQNLLVGGVVGYEASTTESNDKSETDSDGFVLSAYAAYNFSSGFTAYGHIGYDHADTDIKDRTITGNTAIYKGDYDLDSVLFGFGVIRTSELESGQLFTMDLGYNYAYSGSESYNATHSVNGNSIKMKIDSIRVSEFLLNTELAQPQSWGEYYASLGAVIDVADNDDVFIEEDSLGINAGFGIRFNASENFLGDIGFNKMFFKKGEEDYSFTMNFRYNF